MAYEYTVVKGDTLFRIARRTGITVGELAGANPQIQGSILYPGQVLTVPDPIPRHYVVQRGDTFYEIARRFNIALDDLLRANPGVDPARMAIGTRLILPPSRGMSIVGPAFPYGYPELLEDLQLLQIRYPFLEYIDIGESVLGKPIPAFKVGDGPVQVHVNAAIHANEWITAAVVMKIAEDLSEAYRNGVPLQGRDVRALLSKVTLWIAPMLNPDGVELVQEGLSAGHPYYRQLLEWNGGSYDFSGWKANIRGVDLNDQFPAGWEIERNRRAVAGPGPRDWTGTAPLTEPEAIAVADFTRNNDFRLVLALHTQGQEIYYTYRGLEPPVSAEIAANFARVSGYTPVANIESDAGYKDWFIQEYRLPGFTIESGKGTNPLPTDQFPAIKREVTGILLEALAAAPDVEPAGE
ncbi:M14 family metallopeptidase [Gorillibacterium timonense]|uniref:M14 family metallopeptidase n=1 Tax=Gorillibacterium timonense TaxID=1689269 RepID=UPI00071E10A3|nr:M14 family zinc carboxypeptidase [Gorillibacterium timonense]